MAPKEIEFKHDAALAQRTLIDMIDSGHDLVRLTDRIDWQAAGSQFGELYVEGLGRPGVPIRLMTGLDYLKHAFNLSDEMVVARWVENPYRQYFCGEQYFQYRLPIHPTHLTRFRKRIGKEGGEFMLKLAIHAGIKTKTITPRSFDAVNVDTTVTESHCVSHRCRVVPQGAAGQMRRIESRPELRARFAGLLDTAHRIHAQQRHDKHKVYSVHAREVECIAKGKAHKRYEVGVKVSIATTNRDNFVVGIQSLPGNPYDEHTLKRTIDQVAALTGAVPKQGYVDRGYRGHLVDALSVWIAGAKRGVTATILKRLKRRNAIEPVIGHMKSDGRPGRNFLNGAAGDAINALLCASGQNMRKIVSHLHFCAAENHAAA